MAWLRDHAAALTSTHPEAPLSDLAPLADACNGAQLIGIGEATHGTREHFLMKHRLFRFLVEEKGFRTLAMEADGAASCALDTYVRTGAGDPALAIYDLGFWTWNTQEVLDMVLWMREYNRTAPSGSQLRFIGLDMQNPTTATSRVAEFLHGVDPGLEREAREAASCLGPLDSVQEFYANYRERPPEDQTVCSTRLAALHAKLVEEKASWSLRDPAGYDCAVWSAHLLTQLEKLLRVANARDGLMADNAAALVADKRESGGVMIWAHNAHVAKASGAMGRMLDRRLGRKYLAIGQTFAVGEFHARSRLSEKKTGPLTAFPTPPLRADSYERAFERVGLPLFAIDLRLAQEAGTTWLAGPHPLHEVGGSYYEGKGDSTSYSLTEAFDLMLYHQRSTPTLMLPRPPNRVPIPQ